MGMMVGGYVGVESFNSFGFGGFMVFFVYVVGIRLGVVVDLDVEVFDFEGVFFGDLWYGLVFFVFG